MVLLPITARQKNRVLRLAIYGARLAFILRTHFIIFIATTGVVCTVFIVFRLLIFDSTSAVIAVFFIG